MKKISEYLFLWGTRWLDLLYAGNSFPRFFPLVHVRAGRDLSDVFLAYQGQQVHWQDDFLLQVFRCSIFVTAAEFITGIIVNKWFALACMGLQLYAISVVWSDMSAVHHAIYMVSAQQGSI